MADSSVSDQSGSFQYYAVVFLFSFCFLFSVAFALNISEYWSAGLVQLPFLGAFALCLLLWVTFFMQKKRIEDVAFFQTLAFTSSKMPPKYLLVFSRFWISYLVYVMILLVPVALFDRLNGSLNSVEWGGYAGLLALVLASSPLSFLKSVGFKLFKKAEDSTGMPKHRYENWMFHLYKGVLAFGLFPCLTLGFYFMDRYMVAWPLLFVSMIYLLFGYVAISTNSQYRRFLLIQAEEN